MPTPTSTREKIATLLIAPATLLWVIALLAATVHQALLSPNLYRRWLHDTAALAVASAELAPVFTDLPAVSWPPWIPREAERLQEALDTVFNLPQFEALVADGALSWAKWLFGVTASPDAFTASLDVYVQGSAGDAMRTALWYSLPLCSDPSLIAAPSPYCIPEEVGARPAVGQKHQTWWDSYSVTMLTWARDEETAFLAALPAPPRSLAYVAYAPWFVGVLGAVIVFGLPARKRGWGISIPLSVGGVLVSLLGLLLWRDLIALPQWIVTALPFVYDYSGIFWYGWLRLIGPTLVVFGLASCLLAAAVGVVCARARVWRTVLGMCTLACFTVIIFMYPGAVFAPLEAPQMALFSTATPWPTLTPTATVTPIPTLTPTLVVVYWPVAEGTPLPTPAASWAQNSTVVGCYHDADAPVLALDVTRDEIRAIYTDHISRRLLHTLVSLEVKRSPVTGTLAIPARSHLQTALIQHQDVYLYTLPDWTRALNSRITPFGQVQAASYVTGRGHLVLGLQNGVLWVVRSTTGGLTWLLQKHASPITTLAAHPRHPYILSGAADGIIYQWDMAAGEHLSTFSGHTSAIRAMVYSPDGALPRGGGQAISADADGVLLRWDVADQSILRQRRLVDLRPSLLLWMDAGLIAGTPQGRVLAMTPNFDLTIVADMGAPVTAIAIASSDYIVAGSAKGDICLWATVSTE